MGDPTWSGWLVHTYFSGERKEQLLKICRGLADIAKELGYTQAQLALAWDLANTDVSTLILGFSKIEQLDENVKAVELYKKWDKSIEAKIEALLENGP
jgi:aryl-alcohol dehydrogenase-like predicted oxidoreductase